MKIRNILLAVFVCLTTTMTVLAEFTAPTEAQINDAAGNPAQLAALLKGASLEEASHVVKTVIAQIAGLGLSATALESRIQLAMNTAVAAEPAASLSSFAAMLGTEMGYDLAIRSQAAVISATQGALTASAGTAGAAVAKAFGDAFTASSGSGNTQNAKNTDTPPKAKLYPVKSNDIKDNYLLNQ